MSTRNQSLASANETPETSSSSVDSFLKALTGPRQDFYLLCAFIPAGAWCWAWMKWCNHIYAWTDSLSPTWFGGTLGVTYSVLSIFAAIILFITAAGLGFFGSPGDFD